ncbi:MAG: type II secretion system protein N [Candidatus Brocadiia bacterium]
MLRRALWAANLALLVLLTYLVADTVVSALGTRGGSDSEAAAALRPTEEGLSEPVGMGESAVILNRNIFGVSVRFPQGPQPARRPAPAPPPAPPRLRLKLLGTIVADTPLARAVILDEGSGTQDVYALGDTVQGARLDRIEQHAVHLVRGSQREMLELDFPPSAGGPAPATSEPERSVSRRPRSGTTRRQPPPAHVVDRRRMAERVQSIAEVLTSPGVKPYRESGQIRGLLVPSVSSDRVRNLSGLRPGDVVSAVNGTVVVSAEQARRAIEEATKGSVLRLTLLRDGTERVVAYHLN